MELQTFVGRASIALLTGALIGLERQLRHKMAGVRTNALAALGAALFVLLSFMATPPQGDVTRIIAQVVTGVGFLGAGIIFKEGLSVHGLTTAVTIWCSSAIGCLAGAGFTWEAVSASVMVVLVNASLKPLDDWLDKRSDR
ncbi:MAG: MgtC/SapB family protein [Bacteroidetes bacterium]|nr:MgtC/SapB family protein [Bacteroidota bacterium]